MKWTRPLPADLPAKVHRDSGHEHTSWSGELRAVVDDEQLVIRVWSRAKQVWRYSVVWRYDWEQGWIRPGPLPRRYHRDDEGGPPVYLTPDGDATTDPAKGDPRGTPAGEKP